MTTSLIGRFFVCLWKSRSLISVARFYQFIDFNARHTYTQSEPPQSLLTPALRCSGLHVGRWILHLCRSITRYTNYFHPKSGPFLVYTWIIARFNWLAHTSSGYFFSDFFANFSTLIKFPCKLKKKKKTKVSTITMKFNNHNDTKFTWTMVEKYGLEIIPLFPLTKDNSRFLTVGESRSAW